jgi:NodT family efflux transporter outer membrane factor (OMF) lipoprotein
VDVFGGVRRSVEAADADLSASREDLHGVLVSLVAETALNYVEARTFQTRLAVAQANIKTQEESYDLTRSRFEAGLSDELAVHQARYNLESSRSQLPTLRTGLEAAKNRLAVLLGMEPGALHPELAESRPIPVIPATLAVGVPAEALRQRPDVRQAERRLAARSARVGVATADLYPKFRLSGSIGLQSTRAEDLLEYGSRTWRIGPSVSWNLFDAGAVRRNIEVQSALQEQALIQYEASILGALEEVENALVAYAGEQLRRASLVSATEAAQSATRMAQDRYKAGLVDFSSVLDSQRSLLSFEDNLAQSDGVVTANLVRLYKALGGGWQSDSAQPEVTP